MGTTELRQTLIELSNDINILRESSKNIFTAYLSNQFDKKIISDCLYPMLGAVIKLVGYDLRDCIKELGNNEKPEPQVCDTPCEQPIVPAAVTNVSVPKNIFQERVKTLRAKHKLSLRELASLLNIQYSTVWAWESKGSIPKQATLEELAKLFNVPSQYLVGEGEE